MSQRRYKITWSATAREMLINISDRRIQGKIIDRVDGLSIEPGKQGKELIGELSGLRSIRAAGQRYRIIFQVEDERVIVLVVALGLRADASKRDVYSLAKKLVRLGLVESLPAKRR